MCVRELKDFMHGGIFFFFFLECIWLYGDVCVCVQLRMCKCGGYGRMHGYICEGKCTYVRVCVCGRVEVCL